MIVKISLSNVLRAIAFFIAVLPLTAEGVIHIKPIDDPLILSHRFIMREKNTSRNGDIWVPIDIYGDGRMGQIIIGQNWNPPDTMTCIVFYNDIYRSRALKHVNLRTLGLINPIVYDFDRDKIQEVGVVYTMRDSVWFEIVDVDSVSLAHQFLISGKDMDGNGYWDGGGNICGVWDINGDGFVEVFIRFDTGYDLYPRGLLCVDWKNEKIIWRYDLAGVINHKNFFIIPSNDDINSDLIVFGVNSKGNDVTERDMDDQHSYVIVLDENGKELWKVETGETFTSGMPLLVDYDRDGANEILVNVVNNKDSTGNTLDVESGIIQVYKSGGQLIATKILGPNRCIVRNGTCDFNNDGFNEIWMSLADNTIIIYDQQLHVMRECSLYVPSRILDCEDYIGSGKNQVLIQTGDNRLLLADCDFKPLALTEFKDDMRISSYYASGIHPGIEKQYIIINNDYATENYVYTIEKSPWYTIFSRHPILAFLAAFIPLTIIIGVIWYIMAKFKSKNKLISEQRDKLNHALAELKETQQKLIESEKYRMAKDIAGGVAHEIHNALFPAGSSLDKLDELLNSRESVDPDRVNRLLKMAGKSISRANKMTDLVSFYSKLDAERKNEKVELKSLLEEIADGNRDGITERSISVAVDIPDDLNISCARVHAYSLFNNLMVNSIDALSEKEKGMITIKAEAVDKGMAKVVFSDNGPGISAENRPRIFEAFFSTKPNTGTGLGLAIVRKIVELYDGEIEVESVLDKGTKFVILIPIT